MEVNYLVVIEEFAKRHYIKSFEKKYKNAWEITLRSIIVEFEHIDRFFLTDKADPITDIDGITIAKTDFKVAGTKESAKSSGNRCIILVDEKLKSVSVLLVYSKTDLPSTNETAEWKKIILKNYPELKKYLTVN